MRVPVATARIRVLQVVEKLRGVRQPETREQMRMRVPVATARIRVLQVVEQLRGVRQPGTREQLRSEFWMRQPGSECPKPSSSSAVSERPPIHAREKLARAALEVERAGRRRASPLAERAPFGPCEAGDRRDRLGERARV